VRPHVAPHTCTSGARPPWPLRRPPSGGATGSPGQRIGIQAGRFPASQIQCDQGGRSGPSRDGADTSDASASPPLTALAIAARATRTQEIPGCGRFCGRFCGRPQPNMASHEHIHPYPTDPRRAPRLHRRRSQRAARDLPGLRLRARRPGRAARHLSRPSPPGAQRRPAGLGRPDLSRGPVRPWLNPGALHRQVGGPGRGLLPAHRRPPTDRRCRPRGVLVGRR